MASVLVGYVRLKVFALITLTMSPCDKRRFLELNLVDITHWIFPSILMRSYWTKHAKSKWLTKMQGAKSCQNIWHQGCPCSQLHFLNIFPFFIPTQLHASHLGEFDSQSHRVLDWRLQRLGL